MTLQVSLYLLYFGYEIRPAELAGGQGLGALSKIGSETAATTRFETVGLRLQVASRLFDHFAQVRGRLGVDSDSQQILFSFVLTGLAEASRLQGSQSQFSPNNFVARLNASTISDMTGIPRETVRRKLIKLGALGLLTTEHQGFYVMDRYWPDLDIVEALGWMLR